MCSHISLNTIEENKRIKGKPCLCVRIFHSTQSKKINALRGNSVCVLHISLNTIEENKRIKGKQCLCVSIFHSTQSKKIKALRGNRVCVFVGFNIFEQNRVNWSILKAFG